MRFNAHSSMQVDRSHFDFAQYLNNTANDNISHVKNKKQDAWAMTERYEFILWPAASRKSSSLSDQA
jgi:hypothetical protein